MSPTTMFLAGLVITMGIAFAALAYLKASLFLVLNTLCGAPERAHFWTAFSTVTLFLVPLMFALAVRPDGNGSPGAVFQISSQIEWGIIGFVGSVLVMGAVLSKNIMRFEEMRRRGISQR